MDLRQLTKKANDRMKHKMNDLIHNRKKNIWPLAKKNT